MNNYTYTNSTNLLEEWLYGEAEDSPSYNFTAQGEFTIIALRDEDDSDLLSESLLDKLRSAKLFSEDEDDESDEWRRNWAPLPTPTPPSPLPARFLAGPTPSAPSGDAPAKCKCGADAPYNYRTGRPAHAGEASWCMSCFNDAINQGCERIENAEPHELDAVFVSVMGWAGEAEEALDFMAQCDEDEDAADDDAIGTIGWK